MEWYYVTRDDVRHGPVDDGVIRRIIADGELSPGDLVWHEGMPGWQPCGELAALSVHIPAPPAVDGEVSPYAPPQADDMSPAIRTGSNGKAVTSLVFGIVSAVSGVFTWLCCIGWVVAIPCGIVAIGLGRQVLKEDQLYQIHSPAARGGLFTGWTGLVLGGLNFLIVAAFFLFALSR